MARILIVDDESLVRIMLRQMVEKDGHTVTEASNGAVGLRVLREQPVDLLITDIVMPEREGIEVIMEVRQKFPQVKIIAISGGGRSNKLEKSHLLAVAATLGQARTLAKPFTRQQLLEAVRAALGQQAGAVAPSLTSAS